MSYYAAQDIPINSDNIGLLLERIQVLIHMVLRQPPSDHNVRMHNVTHNPIICWRITSINSTADGVTLWVPSGINRHQIRAFQEHI